MSLNQLFGHVGWLAKLAQTLQTSLKLNGVEDGFDIVSNFPQQLSLLLARCEFPRFVFLPLHLSLNLRCDDNLPIPFVRSLPSYD